jgi:hypothetical protein
MRQGGQEHLAALNAHAPHKRPNTWMFELI